MKILPHVPLFPKIRALCARIEKEQGIRLLFCVENGSRAWRLESADSDYDVRFVFARKVNEYFCLKPKPDVIVMYYDKNLKPCGIKDACIDMVGFDVLKFARLLANSNPTAIEWLVTDIVYYGKQNESFRRFALRSFCPASLVYHYQSLCRQNYFKYIRSGNLVSYKKYLYAFRGLVNARHVKNSNTLPPIDFTEALRKKGIIPEKVREKLEEMIRMKKECRENEIVGRIPVLDSCIEAFLEEKIVPAVCREKDTRFVEKGLQDVFFKQ